ncbi:MAG: hypothetical protein M2R45_03629 [Verrucomicrobia subdivision 3 bacterium]|nr:hypothetical protein [Limisphaerales bacterium]MCS1416875.1 hypothetical protein [Limisphaerales bacterium]
MAAPKTESKNQSENTRGITSKKENQAGNQSEGFAVNPKCLLFMFFHAGLPPFAEDAAFSCTETPAERQTTKRNTTKDMKRIKREDIGTDRKNRGPELLEESKESP